MKKVLQIVTALAFGFVAITSTASAASSCVIENTGPGSTNVCTNTESVNCVVNENNTVTFTNTNNQEATTGTGTASGNTTVYNVSTGSASNDNTVSANITVVNRGCVLTTVTRTPVTPEAPVTTTPAVSTPVAKLPKTSSVSPLTYVGIALAGAAGLALVTRLSLAAYAAKR